MAARYVFSIHSNTKWGVGLGVSFLTGWCVSDADALALGEMLNLWLANYAKVSVSKIIAECPSFDIPDQNAYLHDVGITSFVLSNSDGTARRTVKVPLNMINTPAGWSPAGMTELANALKRYFVSVDGGEFTNVMASGTQIKNVVQGGPTD